MNEGVGASLPGQKYCTMPTPGRMLSPRKGDSRPGGKVEALTLQTLAGFHLSGAELTPCYSGSGHGNANEQSLRCAKVHPDLSEPRYILKSEFLLLHYLCQNATHWPCFDFAVLPPAVIEVFC
jgi:hypothetical protein